MNAKDELIKEAWGIIWLTLTQEQKNIILNNDGFLNLVPDETLKYIEQNEHLIDFIAKKGYRPYSLKNIGSNNGWIKIESDESLPKQSICCHFVLLGETLLGSYHIDFNRFSCDKRFGWNKGVTHYRPIKTPKPPLY